MKTTIYKLTLVMVFLFIPMSIVHGEDVVIQGQDIVEIPYAQESYIYYTCPLGFKIIPYEAHGITLKEDGLLILTEEAKKQSLVITATNHKGTTIKKEIQIQSSWVIESKAKDYYIPKHTTKSSIQSLHYLAEDIETRNLLQIIILLAGTLLIALYLYIHTRVTSGGEK